MGYTHYFTPKINKEQFDKIAADVKVIEGAVDLFDGRGESKGVVYEDDEIMFNGDASKGEDHETLVINTSGEWNFCKTARKPYDDAVVVTLLCLKFHSPESEVSSDGDSGDWVEGKELFKKLFPDRDVPKIEL